ncbi:putative protein EXORDIUM [Iris pallida]|uniref:Uncharacterized protein n=1 Tax=Iris pallida TaxID=29817 RepID=A0AAX6H7F2_IRIPA|nr:putative protein EXORDIUM [Iris pallida]
MASSSLLCVPTPSPSSSILASERERSPRWWRSNRWHSRTTTDRSSPDPFPSTSFGTVSSPRHSAPSSPTSSPPLLLLRRSPEPAFGLHLVADRGEILLHVDFERREACHHSRRPDPRRLLLARQIAERLRHRPAGGGAWSGGARGRGDSVSVVPPPTTSRSTGSAGAGAGPTARPPPARPGRPTSGSGTPRPVSGTCAWPFHRPAYGPQSPPWWRNGDVGVDGMVVNLAGLLAGAVTNPFGSGFFQGPKEAPLEAASACPGIYGKGAYPGYAGELLVDTASGASYNARGARGRKYLVPALVDVDGRLCYVGLMVSGMVALLYFCLICIYTVYVYF